MNTEQINAELNALRANGWSFSEYAENEKGITFQGEKHVGDMNFVKMLLTFKKVTGK